MGNCTQEAQKRSEGKRKQGKAESPTSTSEGVSTRLPRGGAEDVRSGLGVLLPFLSFKEKKRSGEGTLGSNEFHAKWPWLLRPGQLEARPEKTGVSACLLLTQGHLLSMQHHWEQALCLALWCSSHGPAPCPAPDTSSLGRTWAAHVISPSFPPVKWGWREWLMPLFMYSKYFVINQCLFAKYVP